jgi:hypothetical protein
VGKKKAEVESLFEHGEVINYTLDGVSIHPVTKDTGVRPNSIAGEEGNRSDFTMRPMVTLKQLQSLMAVIGENGGWINYIVATPQYQPN